VESLQPATLYVFRMAASNAVGVGTFGLELNATTRVSGLNSARFRNEILLIIIQTFFFLIQRSIINLSYAVKDGLHIRFIVLLLQFFR